jgi:hypothetical protein
VQLERNIASKELCKTYSFLPPPFYSTSPLIIDKTQSIISLTASLKSSSSCITLTIAGYLFPGCAGSSLAVPYVIVIIVENEGMRAGRKYLQISCLTS